VSRARNSGSLRYHAVAAVFSNGVWFASQFFVVAVLSEVIAAKDVGLGLATALFYLLLTTVSSVGMHYFLMNKVEKGKAKVGA
jgi:hypothetical protein